MASLDARRETEGQAGGRRHSGLSGHARVSLGDDILLLGDTSGAKHIVGGGVHLGMDASVTAA